MKCRWAIVTLWLAGCGTQAATDGTSGSSGGGETEAGTGDPSTSGASSSTTTGGASTQSVGTTGSDDGSTSDASSTEGGSTTGATGDDDGVLQVLSYNVAGLPGVISGSDPAVNTPLISPMLNAYELVLAQEDFSYHAALAGDAEHPYQSEPGGTGTLGDGLNRFSQTEFLGFERHAWEECNGVFDSGSDCLTDKGFSVATHELATGVFVDVYNFHMDASSSNADIEARQAQVAQMLARISETPDRALIVAGDTNMDEEDEPELQTLLVGANLVDACRALDCGEEYRIDRVMIRSSDSVELAAAAWSVDETFVDDNGDPLSDHEPVAVDIEWTAL